jgi:hypothetical protein
MIDSERYASVVDEKGIVRYISEAEFDASIL